MVDRDVRNVVAHGYAGIDPGLIHRAAIRAPGAFDRFSKEVSQWMSERLGL